MAKPIDSDRPRAGLSGAREDDSPSRAGTQIDPQRPRPGDPSTSRVDTLPEDFARLISRRPHGVGDVVGGRYRLVEKLGAGAMGDVFVAENLSIGLKVAVKLLKPDLLADAHFRERFQREAEAIAAIEHPNVARFLDLVVGDPTFLVMEYVRGPALSQRLREVGKLPLDRAIALSVRLCWAVRAAHAVGVIHRDLKPSNVILTSHVENGEVPKLIDFGLAKLAARKAEQSLTRTGQLIGTPPYMSPEQISNKRIDERTDIYALACLVYELCAGRPPFSGDDDFQVLYKQVHEPPPPLRKLLPEAPAALEGVLACALAKNPEERYANMGELAVALEESLASGRALTQKQARERSYREVDSRLMAAVGSISSPALPAPPPPRWRLYGAVTAGVLALAFGGGYAASRLAHPGAQAATRATLFVLSDPPGALVELDGKALPQTTPTLAGELPPGQHEVKIQRVGAAAVSQTVSLKAGERASVQVVLPPATHKLEVRTVPDGAAVYLDRRLVLGDTPTTIEVTDDEFHELRFEKTGYEPLTQSITPDDHAPQLSLTLTPERQPRGTLMVDADRPSEVWLDGADTGYTTPTLGLEVGLGDHLVEVHDPAGGKPLSAKVTVAQGQTVHLRLSAASASQAPAARP